MSTKKGRVGGVTSSRSDLVQLVLVAIVLALGTGVTATGVAMLTGPSPAAIVLAGLGIVAAGLIVVAAKVASQLNGTLTVEGVIFVESKTRKPIDVKRYELANEISRSVEALGTENKALGKAWTENPFEKFTEPAPGQYKLERTIAHRLGIEVIEYYVLRRLSTQLTDYFNSSEETNKEDLRELTRSDMPAVLLENRYIDLFSRPFEEREVFGDRFNSDNANVVYAIGKGGVVYDRFDLTLPKDAKVSRTGHGLIRIDTARFSINISCTLGGSSVAGGRDFTSIYLGLSWESVQSTKCLVHVDVSFRKRSLFSRSGWQYYRWLDGFLDRIDEGVNFDRFLKAIGWETALTAEVIRKRSEGATIKRPRPRTRTPAKPRLQ